MILPQRRRCQPRITLGQSLVAIAIATLPIALIMPMVRGTDSALDLDLAGLFCLILTSFCELLFWGGIVALVWFSLAPARPAPAWIEPIFTTEPIIVTPSGTMVEQPRHAPRRSGQLSRS